MWEFGFGESSHYSRIGNSGSLFLNCINHVVYAEHLLPFWESGIWDLGLPLWPAPNKNLGHGVFKEFLGREHSIHLPQFHVKISRHILGDYTGRSLWKLVSAFPQPFPHMLFPFVDCTILQLWVGLYAESHESSKRISECIVVLGTPDTHASEPSRPEDSPVEL